MLRLISVESELTEVKTYLHERGYEIADLSERQRPVEAIIFNGAVLDNPQKTYPPAGGTVLVNAAGLTPEEVESQLENRLS